MDGAGGEGVAGMGEAVDVTREILGDGGGVVIGACSPLTCDIWGAFGVELHRNDGVEPHCLDRAVSTRTE